MTREQYEVLRDTLDTDERREAVLPELERKADPWESSMQATCECLSWRGALDTWSDATPRTTWVRPPTAIFRCMPGLSS